MIDYGKISLTEAHWEMMGYRKVDAPWIVDERYSMATMPEGSEPISLKSGAHLVGSGEQSFIQMHFRDQLMPGQYQCTTPCFRSDPLDRLHQRHFIKVELIKTDRVNQTELIKLVNQALQSFRCWNKGFHTVKTAEGYDIETTTGVEVGSYGIRRWNGFHWIYGTGIAEPRFTMALETFK